MDVVYVPSYDTVSWIKAALIWIIYHFLPFIEGFLSIALVFAIPACLIMVIGIFYSLEKLRVIRKKEKELYFPKVEPAYNETVQGDPALTERWKKITEHIESSNQNDWKQAIIEADIILGEILEKMGYQGDGIGEKLRRVEKADFQTLNEAWEAHKIRNIIAHEGASYELSQYEAKRVIGLYKQVFEEFFYI